MTEEHAVDREQAMAGLRVLIHLVQVDGHVSPEERAALTPSFTALGLGEAEITKMLAEDVDFPRALEQVTDPAVRRAVVMAAYGVARADGTVPEEEAVIEATRAVWGVEVEHLGLIDDLLAQAKQDFVVVHVDAVEDPEERAAQVARLVRARSVGLALLALPPPNVVTEVLGAFVQVWMVRTIGRLHGHDADSQMTKALLGSLLGVVTVHAGLGALVRMVPVWGSAVGAAASYAATYGMGYAADAYFEADGALDEQALRAAFKSFRVQGKKVYEDDDIGARWRGRPTDISELSRRFLRGEIGSQELAYKVREDLDED